MKRRLKSIVRSRLPRLASRWWALKDRVRDRVPAAVQVVRRVARYVAAEERRRARIARWIHEGQQVLGDLGRTSVVFDADGVWIRDANGAVWTHTLGEGMAVLPWRYDEPHEPEEIELLRGRLASGDVLVDIGASVGTFAVELARSVPGLRVLAVEPVHDTYEALLMNVRKNAVAEQVRVVRAALADEPGEAVMTSNLTACNYVVARPGSRARAGEEIVRQLTLDSLLDTTGYEQITLIKCDVEGLELRVLRGARRTLTRHRPDLLLEIDGRWTRRYGHSPEDVLALLADLGYRTQHVLGANVLLSWDGS